ARLRGCERWSDFSDAAWKDAQRAFRIWSKDARRAADFRSLRSERSKLLFEAAFVDGFADELAANAETIATAFDDGFADGWEYAALVRGEWSYRAGYCAGFDEAIDLSAAVAFDATYPAAY